MGTADGWHLSPGTAPGTCGEGACEHATDEDPDEGGFSRSGCDTCGSGLGGTLHAGHLLRGHGDTFECIHVEICVDCLLFSANGDLPECRPERHCGGEGCEEHCADDEDDPKPLMAPRLGRGEPDRFA